MQVRRRPTVYLTVVELALQPPSFDSATRKGLGGDPPKGDSLLREKTGKSFEINPWIQVERE